MKPETSQPIDVTESGKAAVLTLNVPVVAGEEMIEQIRKRVRVRIAQKSTPRLVFNFAQVEYISSECVGELLSAHRKIHDMGGRVAIAQPTPHVREIFKVNRLSRVIPVYDTLEEAVNSVSRRSREKG